jgi:DNA adenine methylase
VVTARPFVKWAGGKTALLPELLKRVPPKFGTYYEPFVGAGALFFALQPERAVIADANHRLMCTYAALAEAPESVITQLRRHDFNHTDAYYYLVRDIDIDARPTSKIAAWFIYLNKTCFNGLYRVNKSGKFNVPIGSYKNPTICDEENLRACSAALQGVTIRRSDFEETVSTAKEGDFCYFDSPYVPVTQTADFTSYTVDGFTYKDQVRLLNTAKALKARGVHVMLSNSATLLVESLYDEHFTLDRVEVRRNVNSKASGRGPVGEYIIT